MTASTASASSWATIELEGHMPPKDEWGNGLEIPPTKIRDIEAVNTIISSLKMDATAKLGPGKRFEIRKEPGEGGPHLSDYGNGVTRQPARYAWYRNKEMDCNGYWHRNSWQDNGWVSTGGYFLIERCVTGT